MSLVEAVIRALIYICVLVLCFFLIVWVLGAIGLVLPAMVEKILLVIVVLIAILVLIRLLWAPLSSYNWWGPPRP